MIIYLVCSVFSLLVFLYSKNIGNKLNLIDVPDNLTKVHVGNVPLVGGIGLIITPIIYYIYLTYSDGINREIISILIFYFSLFIIGIVDDRVALSGYKKLLFVFIFSYIFLSMSHHHFKIDEIYFYFASGFSIKLLDFWVIFLSTCFSIFIFGLNISDGKNGVTLSYSIILLLLFYLFYYEEEIGFFISLNILIMFIALIFNLKNLLFLGSNGVNVLCITILITSIHLYKLKIIHFDELVLIFYIHIFEIIRLFIYRFIINQNPFKRDVNHLHHLIFRKFSTLNSVIIYNFISFFPFIIFLISKNIVSGFILSILIYFFILYFLRSKTNFV